MLGISSVAQAKNLPAPIKAIDAQGVEVMDIFAAPGGLNGQVKAIN